MKINTGEFYNEDQKNKFIQSLNEPQKENKFKNLFLNLARSEKRLQKDLSEMNIPEAKSTIILLDVLTTGNLSVTFSYLREYVSWCIANGKIFGENVLYKIQPQDIDFSSNIQNRLLKSPEHLQNVLDTAFGDECAYLKYQSEFIAWLLFYGCNINEISTFKKSNNELVLKIVKEKNSSISKTHLDLMSSVFERCSDLEFNEETCSDGKTKTIYLQDTPYVLRGRRSVRTKEIIANDLFRTRIRNINAKYTEVTGEGIFLSLDRIYRSGIFYRLYQMELSGVNLTVELIQEYYKKYYPEQKIPLDLIYKKMLDYKKWKYAFNLKA